MKLSEYKIVRPAQKVVPIRITGCDEEFQVGIRFLSPAERAGVIRRAKESAAANGVEKWDENDPACVLELWIETVAACTYDVDSGELLEPWTTPDDLRKHSSIGQDNLAYLYEVFERFEQECSVRVAHDIGAAEFMTFCLECAEGGTDFLDRYRPGTLASLTHTMAVQYLRLLQSKSQDSTDTDSVSES